MTMNIKIRPDLSINSLETLWIELELPKSKPFILGVVYHPPNSLQSWIDLFEEEFESAHSENKEIILMGDFNIPYFVVYNTHRFT